MTGLAAHRIRDGLGRFLDSDFIYSFRRSPAVVVAFAVTVVFMLSALFAPWIVPHNTYEVMTLNLSDAFLPPSWIEGGKFAYLFGTDDQGRDVFSTIILGMRVSLLVGFLAVLFAMTLGISLGLIAGYVGGTLDAVIMRVADVQLSFPAILIVLLIDGVARGLLPRDMHDRVVVYVIVLAIGLTGWVQFARTVRGSTLVEKNKEYVQSARLIGLHPGLILFRHVLPNVMGPVLVIATLNLALAILQESTLSFLGVGVPPTEPSLGTLISVGNNFLFSGEWWMAIFPGVFLVVLVLSVNFLGDWLRDALNPKLR
ncbi:MAG: ABC transporter permease [Proteobacteria bacterium]|nr:ABC transporter permease [Pseudomonadota bacterium]MBI3497272.1 ABC transporter permease [Pseudomonadota bacterium]